MDCPYNARSKQIFSFQRGDKKAQEALPTSKLSDLVSTHQPRSKRSIEVALHSRRQSTLPKLCTSSTFSSECSVEEKDSRYHRGPPFSPNASPSSLANFHLLGPRQISIHGSMIHDALLHLAITSLVIRLWPLKPVKFAVPLAPRTLTPGLV